MSIKTDEKTDNHTKAASVADNPDLPALVRPWRNQLDEHDFRIVLCVDTVSREAGGNATVETAALCSKVGLDLYELTLRIIHLIRDGVLICDDRFAASYSLRVAEQAPGDRPDRSDSPEAA